MTQNYLEKEKFWFIIRKKKLLLNLYIKLRNMSIFLSRNWNSIHNRFQQKTQIETLRKIEILLLKALPDEDFKLQQTSSFFGSDLHKIKLETQLKTLTDIVDGE